MSLGTICVNLVLLSPWAWITRMDFFEHHWIVWSPPSRSVTNTSGGSKFRSRKILAAPSAATYTHPALFRTNCSKTLVSDGPAPKTTQTLPFIRFLSSSSAVFVLLANPSSISEAFPSSSGLSFNFFVIRGYHNLSHSFCSIFDTFHETRSLFE